MSRCPECGRSSRVPEDAPDEKGIVCCPKCLAKVPVKAVALRPSVARLLRGVPRWVLLIVLLGAAATVAIGGTFLWRYAFPDYPGAVESTRLYAVCQANGAVAEKQYAGKEILVAGTAVPD